MEFSGKGTVDPGVRAFVEKRVKERAAALAQLTPGKSVLNITVRKDGKKLSCVYKSHDETSITVESSNKEVTFGFLDIKIGG